MTTITDDDMRRMLPTAKAYTAVILSPGPHRHDQGADQIIWEHARRNFQLRADGLLNIVCPMGEPDVSGIGIFDASVEQVRTLMATDPAVMAGVLTFQVLACRSFPGDHLV